ncbi:MAG: two-component sensor histidine kinase, partial [Dorea sp.]|nr:two-component sensor histidine kinase [Dorea sp.]
MSIRNGEWVIISGVKKYFKKNIFRSMKFRIILLVALAGIVPVLIMIGVFLTSYEKRAVEV